jgi:hypothetical protein
MLEWPRWLAALGRDGDYIKSVIFSDRASRGELNECALSLALLDSGDYKDKSLLRRGLSESLS